MREKDKMLDKLNLNVSKTNIMSEDKYRNLYYQISKKQEEIQELKFKNSDLEEQCKVYKYIN
jgi:hypothetical protein